MQNLPVAASYYNISYGRVIISMLFNFFHYTLKKRLIYETSRGTFPFMLCKNEWNIHKLIQVHSFGIWDLRLCAYKYRRENQHFNKSTFLKDLKVFWEKA